MGSAGSWQFVKQRNKTAQALRFQAILPEGTGDILMQYQEVLSGFGLQATPANKGSSAGVGIREIDGHLNGRNLQWSFAPGMAVTPNDWAILFSSVPEPSTFLLSGLVARKRRR